MKIINCTLHTLQLNKRAIRVWRYYRVIDTELLALCSYRQQSRNHLKE